MATISKDKNTARLSGKNVWSAIKWSGQNPTSPTTCCGIKNALLMATISKDKNK